MAICYREPSNEANFGRKIVYRSLGTY